MIQCEIFISASAKNEEKRGGSAVSKKVSSASSSKKGSEAGLNRAEAVKTAEKNGRVPTGKQERPPTTSAEATEENKEQSASEDIRKSQATPVILEQVIYRCSTQYEKKYLGMSSKLYFKLEVF